MAGERDKANVLYDRYTRWCVYFGIAAFCLLTAVSTVHNQLVATLHFRERPITSVLDFCLAGAFAAGAVLPLILGSLQVRENVRRLNARAKREKAA